MIFLNEKIFQKSSDNFRHRKLTLKVRILLTAEETARNLLIFIHLHCVRSLLLFATTFDTLM